MKLKDIKELHVKEVKELKTLLKEKQKTLFDSRLDHSVGKLANTRSLSQIRDDIARIKTIITQKEAQNGKTA